MHKNQHVHRLDTVVMLDLYAILFLRLHELGMVVMLDLYTISP